MEVMSVTATVNAKIVFTHILVKIASICLNQSLHQTNTKIIASHSTHIVKYISRTETHNFCDICYRFCKYFKIGAPRLNLAWRINSTPCVLPIPWHSW